MNPTDSPKTLRRALVVTKQTRLTEIQTSDDTQAQQVLNSGAPIAAKFQVAHDKHHASLKLVKDTLTALGIEYKVVGMTDQKENLDDIDIVVAVGGDGTFLYASHHFGGTVPLLGVNSSYPESAGHFCLAHADNFKTTLTSIIDGTLKPIGLTRLKLTLDGVVLPHRPLNEVGIGHQYFAGTSRYTVTIGDVTESHKGGGIVFGTAAGSTGWLDSIEGKNLPITDRRMQYSVRSVIHPMGEKDRERRLLHRGILPEGATATIISGMSGDDGVLAVDGAHIRYEFPLGAALTVSTDEVLLPAFMDPKTHDIWLAHPYWAPAEPAVAKS